MSGVEALARVLVASADGQQHAAFGGTAMAERILADPGPLLAALAEAGVLRDRADAWDDGFDAGHQAARAVNPEWPTMPANPYRTGRGESS